MSEEKVLRVSLIGGLVVSGLGIMFGLIAGSFAIVFDGVFSLLDAGMTVLSMVVAGLITRSVRSGGLPDSLRARFSFGFWHFEPMVLALRAVVMLGVTLYAGFNALMAIAEGGQPMNFGPALAYAVIVALLCAGFALAVARANRRIGSQILALDAKGWVMAGAVTAALLVAFAIGLMIEGTRYAWAMPYIDPAVLLSVCICLLPVPAAALRGAVRELALVTPPELKSEVDAIAARITVDHGFDGHRAYVARTGRATQIELYFIVPADQPARPLAAWDAIRDRIGDELGGDPAHRWLTIAFTTDPARAG